MQPHSNECRHFIIGKQGRRVQAKMHGHAWSCTCLCVLSTHIAPPPSAGFGEPSHPTSQPYPPAILSLELTRNLVLSRARARLSTRVLSKYSRLCCAAARACNLWLPVTHRPHSPTITAIEMDK
eukprot:1136992-Pelagomonas_calceolata.AAC.2